ncbi:hypothetical protein PHYBOEH_011868 [Phytophthora boehmeriae]|uniref:Uncharacterized protein n=1 Tax=Phytophthora boehmeriae TaxID=109152 RepID=A0A8T1VHH7_9STRA|nr:hypothetical protein PHYBOEH_011868 [Phytophthora boehmeriae]
MAPAKKSKAAGKRATRQRAARGPGLGDAGTSVPRSPVSYRGASDVLERTEGPAELGSGTREAVAKTRPFAISGAVAKANANAEALAEGPELGTPPAEPASTTVVEDTEDVRPAQETVGEDSVAAAAASLGELLVGGASGMGGVEDDDEEGDDYAGEPMDIEEKDTPPDEDVPETHGDEDNDGTSLGERIAERSSSRTSRQDVETPGPVTAAGRPKRIAASVASARIAIQSEEDLRVVRLTRKRLAEDHSHLDEQEEEDDPVDELCEIDRMVAREVRRLDGVDTLEGKSGASSRGNSSSNSVY